MGLLYNDFAKNILQLLILFSKWSMYQLWYIKCHNPNLVTTKHRSKKGCNYYGTLKMARIFHGLHGRAGEAIDVIGHRLWPQRATYAWKVSSTMQAYVLKYFYRVNFKGIGSINNSCGTTFYCTNLIELVMADVAKVKFSFLFLSP